MTPGDVDIIISRQRFKLAVTEIFMEQNEIMFNELNFEDNAPLKI